MFWTIIIIFNENCVNYRNKEIINRWFSLFYRGQGTQSRKVFKVRAPSFIFDIFSHFYENKKLIFGLFYNFSWYTFIRRKVALKKGGCRALILISCRVSQRILEIQWKKGINSQRKKNWIKRKIILPRRWGKCHVGRHKNMFIIHLFLKGFICHFPSQPPNKTYFMTSLLTLSASSSASNINITPFFVICKFVKSLLDLPNFI